MPEAKAWHFMGVSSPTAQPSIKPHADSQVPRRLQDHNLKAHRPEVQK